MRTFPVLSGRSSPYWTYIMVFLNVNSLRTFFIVDVMAKKKRYRAMPTGGVESLRYPKPLAQSWCNLALSWIPNHANCTANLGHCIDNHEKNCENDSQVKVVRQDCGATSNGGTWHSLRIGRDFSVPYPLVRWLLKYEFGHPCQNGHQNVA